MDSITVIIADVSEILRSGIKHLLARSGHIETILSFPSASSLIDAFRNYPEAVCIISSNLPDMTLQDLMKRLTDINSNVKSIVISGQATIKNVNVALNVGVKGYITRQVSAGELEEAVLNVWNDRQAFSQSVSKTIVGHYADVRKHSQSKPKQSITNREKEVLSLIVDGLTSSEIAKKLYISPRTVETHRANLMQKLDIKNTAGLVRYALSEGEQF